MNLGEGLDFFKSVNRGRRVVLPIKELIVRNTE